MHDEEIDGVDSPKLFDDLLSLPPPQSDLCQIDAFNDVQYKEEMTSQQSFSNESSVTMTNQVGKNLTKRNPAIDKHLFAISFSRSIFIHLNDFLVTLFSKLHPFWN